MDQASILYLGTTIGLFVVFALIVMRTMRHERKDAIESPKHRMMEED